MQAGNQLITTAGFREPLSVTPLSARKLFIQALASNTTLVFVGDVSVLAAAVSPAGIGLDASESLILEDVDLSQVYIDARTAGEGVSWLAT